MILGLAVLFPVLSILLFKYFGKYKVNTFRAIIINYFVAFLLSFFLQKQKLDFKEVYASDWIYYALIVGAAFIINFYLISKSTQTNGVGITTLANKMSLILPVGLGIFLLNEGVTGSKILGVLLALVGIYMVTHKSSSKGAKKLFLLLVVFVLTGIMEFSLGYIQNRFFSKGEKMELFVGITFLCSFLLGLLPFLYTIKKVTWRDFAGGILLGFTNGLGVYYLFRALYVYTDNGITLSVVNIGGLLLATCFGYFLFKEKMRMVNVTGLFFCVLALALLLVS